MAHSPFKNWFRSRSSQTPLRGRSVSTAAGLRACRVCTGGAPRDSSDPPNSSVEPKAKRPSATTPQERTSNPRAETILIPKNLRLSVKNPQKKDFFSSFELKITDSTDGNVGGGWSDSLHLSGRWRPGVERFAPPPVASDLCAGSASGSLHWGEAVGSDSYSERIRSVFGVQA